MARPNAVYQNPAYVAARAAAFTRSNGLCQACGRRAATEAHHWALHYPDPDRQTADDLIALCDACHGVMTSMRRFEAAGGSVLPRTVGLDALPRASILVRILRACGSANRHSTDCSAADAIALVINARWREPLAHSRRREPNHRDSERPQRPPDRHEHRRRFARRGRRYPRSGRSQHLVKDVASDTKRAAVHEWWSKRLEHTPELTPPQRHCVTIIAAAAHKLTTWRSASVRGWGGGC